MKKNILISTFVFLFAAVSLQAQSFQEGFFLDGYTLGFRYNPAISNEGDIISIGQWSSQSINNIGASSFLYPTEDGGLVTALHESISAETFLGNLQPDNYINGAINYNIFSYGRRKGNAYHTLEINVRGCYDASVPKGIFQILKLGTGETSYDLSNMRIGGDAYAEVAYGYSHKLSDIVSVGARAKLLVGVESFRYTLTRLDMNFSQESYRADLEADIELSSHMGKIRTDEDGYFKLTDISAKDKWRLPSGAGLAMDLGVVVTPVEGLTISASILDLGAMFWYYGNAGKSQGTVTFSGVETVSYDQIKAGDLGGAFDGVLDDLKDSIKIKADDNTTSFQAVPYTVNAAVKYELPFYKPLSVGVLGNYIGRKGMPYKEVRGAIAWNPCRKFGVTANVGTGDFGMVYGAAITAGIQRFHINAGLQNGFVKTMPYSSTPLKANNKVINVGLTYDI